MTDETKHTPAPWFAVQNWSKTWEINVRPDELAQSVATVHQNQYIGVEAEMADANAKLIAASPELLEACELALAAFDSSNVRIAYEYAGVVGKLRDAISKAEGRSK